MQRSVLLGAVCLVFVSMGVTRQTGLEGRLAAIEEASSRPRPETVPVEDVNALRTRLATLEAQRAQVEAQRNGEVTALVARIGDLEAELVEANEALDVHRGTLDGVEEIARKVKRIDALEAGADTRWRGVVEALEVTEDRVEQTQAELGRVRAKIGDDEDNLWVKTVAPTVQLAGDATVGSGVLLPSTKIQGEDGYRTLLLTSWHVVRDIQADAATANEPVPVILRDVNGTKRHFTAELLGKDAALDAALLVLDTRLDLGVGATLPTRAALDSARVFDDIIAVGCPLGNDPIPTRGHLSDLHHNVGRELFWMISAPTYIGNSGGGIYDAESRALLGIFSKIYTHGSIRPTVIPHMGLVTPIGEFYDWIDASQIAEVVEGANGATIVVR